MNKTHHHIMIVEATFYKDIAEHLSKGAKEALIDAKCSFECFEVPGALEIPAAITLGADSGKFDGFIALGCVIRGETSHYDIVAGESARALMDLSINDGLAIGNGILTCDTREQAMVRADPKHKNKGRDAVKAAISLIKLREQLS